jgi:SAM-dependent methyltransferase
VTSIVNTAQAHAWNGYEGEHWAAHDDRYDAVNSGFNPVLLDMVGADDRVLDVGCGNGQLTRLAARRARHVSGIDLSGPMLARARSRAQGVSTVNFEQGDAQVHPFQEGAFDLVLSRFGVMFFADPVAAFANIGRALRPAGRLAFLCMTDLEGTDMGAVFGALVPSAPRFQGPLSFADPAHTRSVLAAAGFEDVTCERVEADQVWGRDVADAAAFISAWGPVKHHLDQVDADETGRALDALTVALRPFAEPDAVRLRGTAWLVTAVHYDRT